MARRINLILVRHALSEANLDKSVNMRLPDQAVPLAAIGHDQALDAGDAIVAALLSDHRFQSPVDGAPARTRIVSSPYRRTRETGNGIKKRLDEAGISYDYREEIALREISFGLFDGFSDDELAIHFPTEHAHYQKHLEAEVVIDGRTSRPGEFWAKMPMGESRAEVADRVKGVFGTLLRDADPARPDPVINFIIISHGVTLRAFEMQWMHHPFEWYGEQQNPNNASVALISSIGGVRPYERSQLFDGFKHVRAAEQDRREDGKVS